MATEGERSNQSTPKNTGKAVGAESVRRSHQSLGAKAAETKGVLYFCIHLLRIYGDKLGLLAAPLRAAGAALVAFDELVDDAPAVPSAAQHQEFSSVNSFE